MQIADMPEVSHVHINNIICKNKVFKIPTNNINLLHDNTHQNVVYFKQSRKPFFLHKAQASKESNERSMPVSLEHPLLVLS